MKKSICAILVLASFNAAYADNGDHTIASMNIIDSAHANIINSKGKLIGRATFKQGSEGVVVKIKATELPPGVHGLHFHEVGDCSDHGHFEKSKGHIVTHEKLHGFLNENGPHEADLPNLIVHDDGTVQVELYTNMVSLTGLGWKPELLDDNGSSIIIHENADDYVSQPSGNSGSKIACGTVAAGIPESYR